MAGCQLATRALGKSSFTSCGGHELARRPATHLGLHTLRSLRRPKVVVVLFEQLRDGDAPSVDAAPRGSLRHAVLRRHRLL
ncbi:hypothetical protein MRX96_051442 [Rhipicephalus microplus]